jgi:hypothetical protein
LDGRVAGLTDEVTMTRRKIRGGRRPDDDVYSNFIYGPQFDVWIERIGGDPREHPLFRAWTLREDADGERMVGYEVYSKIDSGEPLGFAVRLCGLGAREVGVRYEVRGDEPGMVVISRNRPWIAVRAGGHPIYGERLLRQIVWHLKS